jgi:signal transduction histidine kinase
MEERGWVGFPSRFDGLVAAGVAVVGQLEVWTPRGVMIKNVVGPKPLLAITYLAVAAALVFRRRWPAVVLVAIVVIESSQWVIAGASEGLGGYFPLLIAVYSMARYDTFRRTIVAAAVALGAMVLNTILDPAVSSFSGSQAIFYWLLLATVPVGVAFRRRAERYVTLQVETRQLRRDRDEQARLAVAEERARIARELHDVIGHAVSVVVVQSVAAQGELEKHQEEQAAARLSSIEATARQALAEMRRLVEILQDDGVLALGPQPGVAALDVLIAQVGEAGLPVTIKVEGTPEDLAPGVDLAVYRVIQEALTNTLKHADATHSQLTIRYLSEGIDIEITDDGRGGAPRVNGDGGGRGLIGMRERVGLYGGVLHTGPDPNGGYVVRARLPLDGGPR